ncbi:MAG: ABC transporter ATP-binding protein [Planctomycetota bacterium]
MTLIELKGVHRLYQSGTTFVRALQEVNLTFEAGRFVAVMGESGSGKSTLLNLLGMLDRPTSGQYILEGLDVSRQNDDALSEIRCRRIGMIFQSFNLLNHFSVLENVCVPMQYAGIGRRAMRERAREVLASVGLAERERHRPTQLSGGESQRVAIARALANNPRILLADEPTGNLDEKTGDEVLAIFRRLRDEGRTIIMVTHNPKYKAVVERVITLHDGKVTQS